MTRLLTTGLLLTGALALLLLPLRHSPWVAVGAGQIENISGLAFVSPARQTTGSAEAPAGTRLPETLIVVHDNKLPGERRIGVVRPTDGRYTSLAWPEGYALPFDLEAVSAVPGETGTVLALSSSGVVFVLTFDGRALGMRATFTLPDRQPGDNFEALRVQQVGGIPVLIWGDRGTGRRPARLGWGRLDLATLSVNAVETITVQVPYPLGTAQTTRHLTDVDVTADGAVWLAAASDPGDLGPFHSAVYLAGQFAARDGRVTFTPSARMRTTTAFARKIEALALTPDGLGLVVGTDDERLGSALATLPR